MENDVDYYPYPECLIIEKPEYKSRLRNFIEFSVSFFLWCWWIFLWVPLIKIILINLGLNINQSVSDDCFFNFINNLFIFLYGSSFSILCIALWSRRDFSNYKKKRKRKETIEVDIEKLADNLGVCRVKILEIQNAKRIAYYFSENDTIKKIDLS